MSAPLCYIIAKQNPQEFVMKKNCVILKWNPAISSYNMSRFLQAIEWEESSSDWSIAQYDRIKAGDHFFMLKVGLGMCGIVASGKITSDPTPGEDWSGRGRKVYYSDYDCDFMVNPETLPILESSVLEDNIPGFDWNSGHSGVVLDDEQAAVLKRLFNKYLRDNAAIFTDRLALIEKRGMDNDQLYIEEELLTEIQGR
jgi:hypothetical protein